MIQLYQGDCLEVMKQIPDKSVDSIVTDPPYELGFMGKAWDNTGIANSVEMWAECLRVLKPGGHLLSFGGSRTYHRMACAIEDAGFEIRDQIMWLYGSGFPKSLDVSKAIDRAIGVEREVVGQVVRGDVQKAKASGVTMAAADANKNNSAIFGYGVENITTPATDAARQWNGWGTALKPAHEPICLARKPLEGTVAANVLKWGTGALNIDGCRIATDDALVGGSGGLLSHVRDVKDYPEDNSYSPSTLGRWPANIIHDGSDEVVCVFPQTSSGAMKREVEAYEGESNTNFLRGRSGPQNQHGDSGSASRFFYCAKTSKKERGEGNTHPTVKPLALMSYLVRLVTPPNGVVLDPFLGSGSTGKAALEEKMNFIGIEKDPDYFQIAKKRIEDAQNQQPNLVDWLDELEEAS